MSNKQYLIDNKELMKEWDWDKNSINPSDISYGSDKKVWWICPKGHSYDSVVHNRIKGVGCPICTNKRVLTGFNDLATTNPRLLKLWNYDKNTILPTEVSGVSGKKVWWICPKGHEWQATIAHIAYGRRCPICNTESSTSFPEQAIFYYLHEEDKSLLSRFKFLNKYEIDIFFFFYKIAIEYDGYRLHTSDKKRTLDDKKETVFLENGLKVIRIREVRKKERIIKEYFKDNNVYFYNNDDISNLNLIIADLIKEIFNKEVVVDVEDSRDIIYNNYIFLEKEKSVASSPKLLAMWDCNKNQKLLPEHFRLVSDKIVWWQCENGHSFKARIHSMSYGKKCPICIEEEITKKSLLVINPNIANEWNYKKNGVLTPDKVLPNSNKKVWWICSKGHEWQAVISSRKQNKCPICGNKLIVKGVNDLTTTNPELVSEWDYSKNKNLTPDNVTIGSGLKVWWICHNNHSYEAVIANRVKGSKCPYCSNQKVYPGFNDLLTLNPLLSKEWNYEKNGTLKPSQVTSGSNKIVWWICSKGHEWQAMINLRNKGIKKCPICKKDDKKH